MIAVTRPVSDTLAECELTHRAREPIDVPRARAQHAAYERTLTSLGCTLVRVAAAPELPDAVFVEDAAVVLDTIAVVTRLGAPSRRSESEPVAAALAGYRTLSRMEAPATLDGGDVLRLGRTLFVGRSSRTNEAGIEQLRSMAATDGCRVVPVDFAGCLHLKSAATALHHDRVLVNPRYVPAAAFPGVQAVCVDEREPDAANALRVADTIVFPSEFPWTRDRIEACGMRVVVTECGELAKAEGAVTCCSLVFEARQAPPL